MITLHWLNVLALFVCGVSGGMLGAAWYVQRRADQINRRVDAARAILNRLVCKRKDGSEWELMVHSPLCNYPLVSVGIPGQNWCNCTKWFEADAKRALTRWVDSVPVGAEK